MNLVEFPDGYALNADCTKRETADKVANLIGNEIGTYIPLIIADPPYGKIVDDYWDHKINVDDNHNITQGKFVNWMVDWCSMWQKYCARGAAFYIWGGVGKVSFRPFFQFLAQIEYPGGFELANYITWGKKRAYGVQYNYLFTREELAYFVCGTTKRPRKFNVPLLTTKRGYDGYNAEYKAKSEYLRRTNVWSDITEIMKGKVHPCEKPLRVIEIPIEVHTDKGEYVVDLFAGSGSTAHAARNLGRRFIVIERDKAIFDSMVSRLRD